jgi:hypothetical protein
VLLTGHPSLTGINTGTGTSGSTAWNASVRSRLYFDHQPRRRARSRPARPRGHEVQLRPHRRIHHAGRTASGCRSLAASARSTKRRTIRKPKNFFDPARTIQAPRPQRQRQADRILVSMARRSGSEKKSKKVARVAGEDPKSGIRSRIRIVVAFVSMEFDPGDCLLHGRPIVY